MIVFVCRYLDLFINFYGYYNASLKVIYISTTALAIYLTRKSSGTGAYDPEQDSFQHIRYIVAPLFFVAVFTTDTNSYSYVVSLLWKFSIYLESVAMLPQLVLVWRHRRVERLAGFYIFSMGLYRMLYILNWIYRAHTERHYRHHWVVYACGVVQSLLYTDFFYYAITKRERPLVTWRRTFANATSANEPLLRDESSRDDEESESNVLLMDDELNERHVEIV